MSTTRYSQPQARCVKCNAPMHPSKKQGEMCSTCLANSGKENSKGTPSSEK